LQGVTAMVVVYFIYQSAFMIYPAIWAYFGQERFGWGTGYVGLSLALFGFMMAVVQGGLIRIILGRFGERKTVIYGHLFDVLAFVVLALVTNGTVALILVPIASFAAVIAPALQGLMSQRVPDDAQGELQGVLVSVSAIASIFGNAIYPVVFWRFAQADGLYFPGAPFFLSALLIGFGLFIFMRVRLGPVPTGQSLST
jgi:DHA1 family tetracycline resistance protein-like MFS transporter